MKLLDPSGHYELLSWSYQAIGEFEFILCKVSIGIPLAICYEFSDIPFNLTLGHIFIACVDLPMLAALTFIASQSYPA